MSEADDVDGLILTILHLHPRNTMRTSDLEDTVAALINIWGSAANAMLGLKNERLKYEFRIDGDDASELYVALTKPKLVPPPRPDPSIPFRKS